jgi:prevent-host-death family protein
LAIKAKDIIPINLIRSRFTKLAEEVRQGQEKIITKNGESYIALVDARRLDYYHQLEKEHIHITLLKEADSGLDDIKAGRVRNVAEVKAKYQAKINRKTSAKKS